MTRKPIIYLAGPAVFHPAAQALFGYMKDICGENGLAGMSPLDGAADWSALPAGQQAAAIRQANIDKIRDCDAVIACVSPFRGPGADAGTAWEMGYAEALGKPVFSWAEDSRPYIERVDHQRDADGRAFCQVHGMVVEDFGLVDNLMLTAGRFAPLADFDAVVKQAAALLLSAPSPTD